MSVLRASREPLVVPLSVFSERGSRICALAGRVGDAKGVAVAVDGMAVKVGIDVRVASVIGVAVGALVGVDSRVLIAVGVNVYVAVADGILTTVGVKVLEAA